MRTILAAAALAIAGCAATDPMVLARSDARFAQVQAGMSQDEVASLLGRPDQVMPFPMSRTVAWSYIYQDQYGYLVDHSITFGADGRMATRNVRRMNDGGDMR